MLERRGEDGRLVGAEPFDFKRGDVGVLLVHGFGGASREMRFLGEHLAEKGFTVKGVVLPGHGRSVYELERTGWGDYYAEVARCFEDLRGNCSKVMGAGLSMGSALLLRLAAEREELAALAVMNPFIYVRHSWYHLLPPEMWTRLIGRFVRFTRKAQLGRINDPAQLKHHVASRFLSMRALLSVIKGLDGVRRSLPRVSQPLLLLQSRNDGTISQKGTRLVFERTASQQKQLVYFERSNHVLSVDYEREEVYELISAFLDKHR